MRYLGPNATVLKIIEKDDAGDTKTTTRGCNYNYLLFF